MDLFARSERGLQGSRSLMYNPGEAFTLSRQLATASSSDQLRVIQEQLQNSTEFLGRQRNQETEPDRTDHDNPTP